MSRDDVRDATRDAPPGESSEVRVEMTPRVVVEGIQPQIDGGRFPIKRTLGEAVRVRADVFADGHDQVAGVLKYRHVSGRDPGSGIGDPGGSGITGPQLQSSSHPRSRISSDSGPRIPDPQSWHEVPLAPMGNDAWNASFIVTELGEYEYTIEAWIDRFATWLAALTAKADAGQDVATDLIEGAEIVQRAVSVRLKPDTTYEATDEDLRLLEIADVLRGRGPQSARVAMACDPQLRALMKARPDRTTSTTTAPPLRVVVDRERARFGAWYEMFPRSCTTDPSRPGTLRDAETRLPAIAALGFDVVYLPPVHPIGRMHRKGRNNAVAAGADDPGSPWAIGSEAGGHTTLDPGLGTLDDFDRFVAAAHHLGLEVALDIAFQASPDHPWVTEHPEWFRHRSDGSIKYAENPPKKYQDIYPFDFDTPEWRSLWRALLDVFLFWIGHGVTIFRVDNPHTKPLPFWEWVTRELRQRHPEVVLLSEAFTRPKVMRYLAKVGFNQSYTYFTWRNSAHELREYLTELTQTELLEYMRPNFFANTPDILHAYLQTGGRPAFEARLILAATLSASYGIYSGFELCENVPVRPGSEEYLDSEKYEIRVRDWNQPGNLNERIARVNQIRRDHPALQSNGGLRFHATDNPALLWFSKRDPGSGIRDPWGSGTRIPPDPRSPIPDLDRVFVVVNTDPHWMQHGHVQMPIGELGLSADQPYVVEDVLDGVRYTWHGEWNYVKLDPRERMAHIFVIHG